MPGKRSTGHADYITPRALYRVVTTPDLVGIEDASIPVLNTDAPPNVQVGLGQSDWNQYGRNAQLDIAVIPCEYTSAVLELWLNAEVYEAYLKAYAGAPRPAPHPVLPLTGYWVLVETKTISGPELWVVRHIPPGKYQIKVVSVDGNSSSEPFEPQVSSSSGTGAAINILVQHAA